MRKGLPLQLYVELPTDGLQSLNRYRQQEERVMNTYARIVAESLAAKRSTKTTFIPWSLSPGSTLSTASLKGFTADQKVFKSCVSSATASRPRGRTVQDGKTLSERLKKTLSERLKSLLEKDKRSLAARLIERASAELGEDHFCYQAEAETLANIDLEKFKAFAAQVVKIREDLDTEYELAILSIGEGSDD